MFVTRAPQKVYFNKFSNENMSYNIETYNENSNSHYFKDFFFYYINNKKQFYDAYKNKSSKNENKTKYKNNVNVDLVIIFYCIIINKMNERLIYYKCYKNLLLTIFCIHISNRNLVDEK